MRNKFTIYNLQFTILIAILAFSLYILHSTFYIVHAQSDNCSGGSSDFRAEGLVSAPELSGIFNTSSGVCITNEQRSAFVSFKIPTYEDLKSIYYAQSKAFKATQLANNNSDYTYNATADLTISSPSDVTSNHTGIIFVDKNLNFGPVLPSNKFQQGNKDSGIVFVVGGDVVIDGSITDIDAVIISSGTIYTAGAGCDTSSVETAKQLVVNGSLISLNDAKPVKFCRKLADNTLAAEKINQQPKYVAILKDIFADSLQKWSEVP